jgi:hypothetical protein
MNTEFQIGDEKITKIAKAFAKDKSYVQAAYDQYKKIFSPRLQGQYLAHVMRGLECHFRKRTQYNRFIIICEPYKKFSPGQKNASADYYRGNRFVINYKQDLPEKELRAHIAHEIGHLFLLAQRDLNEKEWRENGAIYATDPTCSIFGIFIISEKNDFYANYDIAARSSVDWQDILKTFVDMKKTHL